MKESFVYRTFFIRNGEEWWRVRSRVQTPMLKVKNIASYLTLMDEVTLEFLNR